MDWQPIETAPKDGSKVDLWLINQDDPIGWRITDAYWVTDSADERYEFAEDGGYTVVRFRRDGWFAPYHDYEMDGFCDHPRRFNAHPKQQRWIFTEATHWMPLPEPPE